MIFLISFNFSLNNFLPVASTFSRKSGSVLDGRTLNHPSPLKECEAKCFERNRSFKGEGPNSTVKPSNLEILQP